MGIHKVILIGFIGAWLTGSPLLAAGQDSAPATTSQTVSPTKPLKKTDAAPPWKRKISQAFSITGRQDPESKGISTWRDENYYARLNANLQDIIGYQPKALSPGEKTLQGVFGVVSAACASAAAGQALGILPSDRVKKK